MAKNSRADSQKKKRANRPYPACEFTHAQEIGNGIIKHGGGQRVRRLTLLEKMGLNANSGTTRKKITDSGKYNITSGSYAADYLELTQTGSTACDSQIPSRKRREAQFSLAINGIEPFRILYEAFKDKRLPVHEVLVDKLDEDGVIASDLHECADIFLKNAEYLGLIRDVGGAKMLVSIEAVLDELSGASGVDARTSADADDSVVGGAVTIASPAKGSRGKVCFVIMPFVERDEDRPDGFFAEVLKNVITPAVTGAGFEVRTANRRGSDVIQHTIVNELLEADVVLADLTEHNPNVMFELGMRMHADKPVVLIKSRETRRIFDVDNMIRVEEYDPRLWASTIQADIEKIKDHVEAEWKNRNSSVSYMKILRGEARRDTEVTYLAIQP